METRVVVFISCILFTCGSFGLLTVRLSNPFFKGLGWLGSAFCLGSLSAIAFALSPLQSPDFVILLPNLLILSAYISLHVSILEITESKSLIPKLGLSILLLQVMIIIVFRPLHQAEHVSVISLGLLLAIQLTESALRLKQSLADGARAAAWFVIGLLIFFAVCNISRSAFVAVSGTAQTPRRPNALELVSEFTFLGVGLGLGFGMFWMASSHLRIVLEKLANSDELTGLYNRRMLLALCEKELVSSKQQKTNFSMFLLDVDHFKKVNDVYGHRAGDAILRVVAAGLRDSVRSVDKVGRWGGEEFLALLPGADSETARLVAERVRHKMQMLINTGDFLSNASPVTVEVTASIGIATYAESTQSIEGLIHQCDTAMYDAKSAGRNRVACHVLAD